MPILIEQVIAEIDDSVTDPVESSAPTQAVPAPQDEQKLLQTLAIIQQRQERLKID
jgi:hypothetical protein